MLVSVVFDDVMLPSVLAGVVVSVVVVLVVSVLFAAGFEQAAAPSVATAAEAIRSLRMEVMFRRSP